MIRRLDHMQFSVRNLEETVRFLERLGFRVVARTPHHGGSAELQLPGPDQSIFELNKVSGWANPGLNHIAFLVDDVARACEEYRARGVEFEGVPLYVKETGRTIANFRDPDGWRLQLVDPQRAKPS